MASEACRTLFTTVLCARGTFAYLNKQTRDVITRLGIRRRGCRAGNHYRQRLFRARRMTSLVNAVDDFGRIPTIVGNRFVTGISAQSAVRNPSRVQYQKRPPSNLRVIQYCRSWSFPNVCAVNLRSLVPKIDEFSAVIRANTVDIAAVTETFLKPEIPTEVVDLNGYVCHRKDRTDCSGWGGVAVYVRDELNCKRLNQYEKSEFETVWLMYRAQKMPRSVSHIVFAAVYHPPGADSRQLVNHLTDTLDCITRKHPSAGLMLLGDFNHLRDTALLSYPLKQVVKSATRKTATLDKIYTSISEWYERPFTLPPVGRSDHNPVIMRSSFTDPRPVASTTDIVVRRLAQNGNDFLLQALQQTNWFPLYAMQNCDQMVHYFNTAVHSMLDVHMPPRISRRHSRDKPWVDDRFRYMIRRRQFAWRNGLKHEYQVYRNKVKRESRRLRRKYYEKRLQKLRESDSH